VKIRFRTQLGPMMTKNLHEVFKAFSQGEEYVVFIQPPPTHSKTGNVIDSDAPLNYRPVQTTPPAWSRNIMELLISAFLISNVREEWDGWLHAKSNPISPINGESGIDTAWSVDGANVAFPW
jgi:hypothetical protein